MVLFCFVPFSVVLLGCFDILFKLFVCGFAT